MGECAVVGMLPEAQRMQRVNESAKAIVDVLLLWSDEEEEVDSEEEEEEE